MTDREFEARIVDWAHRQRGLEALVLAGSRARPDGQADHWSDWDFHLITTRPQEYRNSSWLAQIAPCWAAQAERTPRGVIKVSAVFENGLEADFVPLAAWQMWLVYTGMKYPGWACWMPHRLWRGIQETRAFMLGSGFRLLAGNPKWHRRFAALDTEWPVMALAEADFIFHMSAFWTKAVWIFKKSARPEPRSAMHWLHLISVQHTYAMLAEEARLAGRAPRPEARKAEQWLDARRMQQTAMATGVEQTLLARALLAELALFEDVCRSVAGSRGFSLPDYTAVAAWLRAELTKLTG